MYILFSIFMMFFSVLNADVLMKTDVVYEHEGTTWNGASMELEGLKLEVMIPNYAGGTLLMNSDGSWAILNGKMNQGIGYVVKTSRFPYNDFPQSKQELMEIFQESNPTYDVKEFDVEKQGAKFGFDLYPKQEGFAFWRFICTNDRNIMIGTDDSNEARRMFFFESVKISSN